MTVLATATHGHLFWITSRAAGVLALLLSSLSISIGLLMGGRLVARRGPELRATHEALSLAALAALAVHGAALLGDGFLHPGVADLVIPFVGSYQRWWTSLGIGAAWAIALLSLSYYARARIGVARWRRLHRWTALAWLASLAHALGEGTDVGTAWFLLAVGIVVLPALALLGYRHTTEPVAADAPRAPQRPAPRPRRVRVGQIRRAVAAVSVTVFLLAFSVVYIQMAAGHDPALAATVSTTSAADPAVVSDDQDGEGESYVPESVTTTQS